MKFPAACPSCGATLDIADQTTRVVCPFCGTPFEVDLSTANPEFHKDVPADPAPEVFVPQDADIITPSGSNPVVGDPFAPSQPDVFTNTPQQSFDLPFIAQAAGRLVGPRLWIALGIAAFIIFCVSCLCMVANGRLIFGMQ